MATKIMILCSCPQAGLIEGIVIMSAVGCVRLEHFQLLYMYM